MRKKQVMGRELVRSRKLAFCFSAFQQKVMLHSFLHEILKIRTSIFNIKIFCNNHMKRIKFWGILIATQLTLDWIVLCFAIGPWRLPGWSDCWKRGDTHLSRPQACSSPCCPAWCQGPDHTHPRTRPAAHSPAWPPGRFGRRSARDTGRPPGSAPRHPGHSSHTWGRGRERERNLRWWVPSTLRPCPAPCLLPLRPPLMWTFCSHLRPGHVNSHAFLSLPN